MVMKRLIKIVKLIRLRILQIELDGYKRVGNRAAVRRVAPIEARLRAEVMSL